MRKAKNESLDNGTQIEFIFHFLYSREFNKLDSMEKNCGEREFGRSWYLIIIFYIGERGKL